MENENPFLTRKPRIWRLPSPDGLSNEGWFQFLYSAAGWLVKNKGIPYGATTLRLNDACYIAEAAQMYVPFEKQGYIDRFNKRRRMAEHNEIPVENFLSEYPPEPLDLPDRFNPSECRLIEMLAYSIQQQQKRHFDLVGAIRALVG